MQPQADLPEPKGRLVENIVHFSRALRKAGIRVGTAQVEDAVRAVEAAGFTSRIDFYNILSATLINRVEHREVFHQVFSMFWRDPELLEKIIHLMSAAVTRDDEKPAKKAGERRAAEALTDQPKAPRAPRERQELQIDAKFSWSANETLRSMDFEQMSAEEATEAAAALRTLRFPTPPFRTRRSALSQAGRRPDLRATLRHALRRAGEVERLALKAPRTRPPDLVVLCDISGSMSAYSRMMMHFLYGLFWSPDRSWGQISAFAFGTRLTNITRALHQKDPDLALQTVGHQVQDWQGGTRIGETLGQFNKDWSRRVLGQGAIVLLITDGLERGSTDRLATEIERLSLSCRRLIWLNPLLRWQSFAPKAAGIRVILRHVDSLHSCHNLDSLADLATALNSPSELSRLAGKE